MKHQVRGIIAQFKELPGDNLVAKAVRGVSFNTVVIDTPVYLKYLYNRSLAAGVSIIRGSVQHIDQIVEGGTYPFTGEGPDVSGPKPPDAVVVCVGLGARTLGGVEDRNMYSVRGQTVLLRAPWVRFGRTLSSGGGEEVWTYVMPRRSGDVSFFGQSGLGA